MPSLRDLQSPAGKTIVALTAVRPRDDEWIVVAGDPKGPQKLLDDADDSLAGERHWSTRSRTRRHRFSRHFQGRHSLLSREVGKSVEKDL